MKAAQHVAPDGADAWDEGSRCTAAGRLVLNVLGAVSQWEREAIGERTSAAMQHVEAPWL